jgi:CDGSH-type Zn-finger protein
LSKNKPYCDGSHRQTWDEEEGNLYAYDENRQRVRVQLLDEAGNPVAPPSEYPPEQ